MPRPRATEPRDQQLLLRLTARQFDVLEAVAHLEHTKPNTYAHQLLVEHLRAMEKNPRVQADFTNRAAYQSEATSAIPLRERERPGTQVPAIIGKKRQRRNRDTS